MLKDEIDFRNELLPGDNIEQQKSRKEEEKPLLPPQVLEDVQMFLAVLLILILTLVVVILKVKGRQDQGTHSRYIFSQINYFSPTLEDGVTFRPLIQNKNSNQKYNGPGFIPCNGFLPCQLEHFPPEYNEKRKEGQMAEWNGIEG